MRNLGVAVLAGAISGFVVGGLGGRLFMFVLAQLNPEETGVVTDDGFEMGQFTLYGTLNLFAFTTVIGIIGGLVFLALRGLRFGPRWFRVLSMPIGVTAVVGSLMVHSDGVDFRLLEPIALAVAMTLAMPLLYTLLVSAIADRWLAPGFRWPDPVAWVARAGFTALIALALVDLVSTVNELPV